MSVSAKKLPILLANTNSSCKYYIISGANPYLAFQLHCRISNLNKTKGKMYIGNTERYVFPAFQQLIRTGIGKSEFYAFLYA